jgi:hypothetical protein
LGIKDRSRTLVIAAPDGFELGAAHHFRAGKLPYDVVLAFCPDQAALRSRLDGAMAATTVAGAVWIAWPKRSSGVPTDLTENIVRDHALTKGLVDVKVCAVDHTWSGLKLVRRLTNR